MYKLLHLTTVPPHFTKHKYVIIKCKYLFPVLLSPLSTDVLADRKSHNLSCLKLFYYQKCNRREKTILLRVKEPTKKHIISTCDV